jgi:pilus assembly protein CpaC
MKVFPITTLGAALLVAAAARAPAQAAPGPQVSPVGMPRPCESVTVDRTVNLTLGKSTILRLPFPAARLIVGGHSATAARPAAVQTAGGTAAPPAAAPASPAAQGTDGVADSDVTLLSPSELFFVGRKPGAMNLILQSADGRCLLKDIIVTVDPGALQAKLAELMPQERGIRVLGADSTLVLSGEVSDASRLDQIVTLAGAYADSRKVVNLLSVSAPQQVMLEVTIAEVSKNVLDKFGIDFSRMVTGGGRSTLMSGILGGGTAVFGQLSGAAASGNILGTAGAVASGSNATVSSTLNTAARRATLLSIEAQTKDGIVRVLAEPNIMAISGQTASFLSGGKIFIPVAQSRDGGGSTITLEEKEFGVGLRFTPTVLDGSRINLKLVSEASELSQTGSPFTSVNGVTAILPSITTRRVDTTVQLGDGQSFAVAGLIKNNSNEALDRLPGLGEVPVMGALFRSTEFQNDQTELLFVVTPRLVRPMTSQAMLPTDNHIVPTRTEVMLMGAGEGQRPVQAQAAGAAPAPSAPSAPTAPQSPAAPQPGSRAEAGPPRPGTADAALLVLPD